MEVTDCEGCCETPQEPTIHNEFSDSSGGIVSSEVLRKRSREQGSGEGMGIEEGYGKCVAVAWERRRYDHDESR